MQVHVLCLGRCIPNWHHQHVIPCADARGPRSTQALTSQSTCCTTTPSGACPSRTTRRSSSTWCWTARSAASRGAPSSRSGPHIRWRSSNGTSALSPQWCGGCCGQTSRTLPRHSWPREELVKQGAPCADGGGRGEADAARIGHRPPPRQDCERNQQCALRARGAAGARLAHQVPLQLHARRQAA